MSALKTPYPGPTFNESGDVTLGVTTSPAAGPTFEYTWIYATNIGSGTVTFGSATVSCNTPLSTTFPTLIPIDNTARLYFKGSGNSTVAFNGYR